MSTAPRSSIEDFDERPLAPSSQSRAYDFIVTNRAGALATADEEGTPHVATIYCIIKQDLTMYFSTRVEGRKFNNLIARPLVSLAFSDEANMATIQMTAKAERVDSLELEQEILHDLIMLRYGEPNWPVPPIKMFERGTTNELAIIKLTPIEMTYGSFETTTEGRYKPFFETVI